MEDKSLKKSLKYANKIEAEYAIILGDEEIRKELYTVKNLNTGVQSSIKINLISEFFKLLQLRFCLYAQYFHG